jgi:CheY-like chemotaxis protein
VMLTSNSSVQDACAEAGIAAAAFLAKPVRRKQLYRTLTQVISGVCCETRSAITMDRGFARRIPLRILLAEDNPVNQKVAALLLDRLGYRPDVVANGLEVLESIRRQVYDLILLDVQMPEMDGLQAARQIRSQSKRGERPWLTALTAGAMQGDRDQAMAAGMDDYLTKPINVAALQIALERCHDALARSVTAAQP